MAPLLLALFAWFTPDVWAQQSGRAFDPSYVRAVGGAGEGWVLFRAEDGRASPYALYAMPEDLPLGSMRLAGTMGGAPRSMTVYRGGLVCVFPPAPGQRSVRRVRSYAFDHSRAAGVTPGPPAAMAPLPGEGRLIDLASADDRLYALIETDREERADAPERTLWVLAGESWERLDTPPDLRAEASFALHGDDNRLILVQRFALGASAFIRDAQGAWTTEDLVLPHEDARVTFVGGRAVSVWREQAQDPLTITMLWGDGSISVRTVEDVPRVFGLAPLGSSVLLAWPSGDGSMNAQVRIIDLSGSVLYEGLAVMRGPVSAADVHTLTLAMVALGALILVFIVRIGEFNGEPALPEGTALATPVRRAAAWVIDLVPGIAISGVIWRHVFTDVGALFDVSGPGGPWPLAVAIGIFIVHSSIGEAASGRTLGKVLLGTRTVTYVGKRPTFWMALSRNIVKGLCPPLAVFSALNPSMLHPAGFQTLVVMRVQP